MIPLKQKWRSRRWTCVPPHSRELKDFIENVNWPVPCSSLLGVTVTTSFCADYCRWSCFVSSCSLFFLSKFPLVVASIEEFADRYHVPKPFIGLILLPIVVSDHLDSPPCHVTFGSYSVFQANAAEHATSVWMAMKNQMELTITICVGSSIVRHRKWKLLLSTGIWLLTQQIAAFVVPLLVIVGWW